MGWMFGNNVCDGSMYAKFVNCVLPEHGEKEGIHLVSNGLFWLTIAWIVSTEPSRTMRVWWSRGVCDVMNHTVDHI